MLSKLIPVFAGLVLGKEIYFKLLFLSKYLSKSASAFVPLKPITFKFLCPAMKSSKSFGSSSSIALSRLPFRFALCATSQIPILDFSKSSFLSE